MTIQVGFSRSLNFKSNDANYSTPDDLVPKTIYASYTAFYDITALDLAKSSRVNGSPYIDPYIEIREYILSGYES